jgi:hypothetical protein
MNQQQAKYLMRFHQEAVKQNANVVQENVLGEKNKYRIYG